MGDALEVPIGPATFRVVTDLTRFWTDSRLSTFTRTEVTFRSGRAVPMRPVACFRPPDARSCRYCGRSSICTRRHTAQCRWGRRRWTCRRGASMALRTRPSRRLASRCGGRGRASGRSCPSRRWARAPTGRRSRRPRRQRTGDGPAGHRHRRCGRRDHPDHRPGVPGERVRRVGAALAVVLSTCLIGVGPASGAPTHASGLAPVHRACGAAPSGWVRCFAEWHAGGSRAAATAIAPAVGLPKSGYGPADIAFGLRARHHPRLRSGCGDRRRIDNPEVESDLAAYRRAWGLPPCTSANGCFRKVNQRGGGRRRRSPIRVGASGDRARRGKPSPPRAPDARSCWSRPTTRHSSTSGSP